MSTIKVSVTEKHIAEGRCEDASLCAVALAVTEALETAGIPADYVHVGVSESDGATPYDGWRAHVRLSQRCDDGGFKWLNAPLGRDVVDWIAAFDHEKPVQPFEVELTWSEEAAS